MHRSRIAVVLIDHPESSYEDAAQFWCGVRGGVRERSGAPLTEVPYEKLESLPGGVHLELQQTGPGTPPRVHLDIESDDIEAEVSRLLAIGATIYQQRDGYVVMSDPGGILFCVVQVQDDEAFAANARTWT